MSEFRRRLMMAGKALPYDAEVEYIETDGYAYIDTGVKASSDVQFNMNFYIPTSPSGLGYWLFGARVSSGVGSLMFANSIDLNRVIYEFGNRAPMASGYIPNGYCNVSNVVGSNTVRVGNATLTATASTFSTNYNIFIFGFNDGGTCDITERHIGLRVLPSRIYVSGILERDYIPVRKNGVGYLYDRVSGQLFGNANNSGAFSYGADVTYTEIEYIESTGSQYIDTGISFQTPFSGYLEMLLTINDDTTKCVFGAYYDLSSVPRLQAVIQNKKWIGVGNHGSYYGITQGQTVPTNNILKFFVTLGSTQNTTETAYIFARNNDNNAYLPTPNMRLFRQVMSSGKNAVRIYIPARVGNIGCLYDLVSKQYFYNAGTDDFIIGNDINT